jgi:hypothetical protein
MELGALRDSQTALQTLVAESTRSSYDHFFTIMDFLERNVHQVQPSTTEDVRKSTVLLYGSARAASASLNTLCPNLHDILFNPRLEFPPNFSKDIALWFLSQFHALLAELLEEEAQKVKALSSKGLTAESRSGSSKCGRRASRPRLPPSTIASFNFCKDKTSRRKHVRQSKSGPFCETATVETRMDAGLLLLQIEVELSARMISSNWKRNRGRLLFLPGHESPLSGVATEFVRRIDPAISDARTLSVFGVHPNNSLVFEYFRAKDVAMVRNMLSERKISPAIEMRLGILFFGYDFRAAFQGNGN